MEIRLYPPENLYVSNHHIYGDFKAKDIFKDKDIREYLKYGIVLTVRYEIKLMRNGPLWFDETVKNIVITDRVRYDFWDEFYIIEGNYPHRYTYFYEDLSLLKKKLGFLKGVKIISTNRIAKKKGYFFHTRNSVKITELNSFFYVIYNVLSVFKYKSTFLESYIYSGKGLLRGKPTSRKPLTIF